MEFIVGLSSDQCVCDLRQFYQCDYGRHLRSGANGDLNAVQFVGAVEHSRLPEHYRRADVVVNPSLSESFGMSLIEAMACGLPVVATAVGGMREVVVGGGTGLLCQAAKPDELAAAILRLLEDRPLAAAMGTAGRRRAEELYSWDCVAGQTLECYREACAECG